jgi:putative transposase
MISIQNSLRHYFTLLMRSYPPSHQRRSNNLPDFDYSHPAVYFVTICTYKQQSLLGEIIAGEMQLSPLGRLVRAEWFQSAETRREIQLFKSEFVVMPNHVHGIVWITGPTGVEDTHPDSLPEGDANNIAAAAPSRLREGKRTLAKSSRSSNLLGSYLATFKASVSSRAEPEFTSGGIWQKNDYENNIRNEAELQNMRVYILTNPIHWAEDQLHPLAPPNSFNSR